MMGTLVFAADMGGTKVDLGLYSLEGDGSAGELFRGDQVPTSSHSSAAELFKDFLGAEASFVKAACIGVAGSVRGKGRSAVATTPNLPWSVSAGEIADATGVERVELINDLVATAMGIDSLGEQDIVTLQEGEEEAGGTRALIAAGTGLGEALLVSCGQGYSPLASEGGHADLAAANAEEYALTEYLREKLGNHVSYERAVSGPGLKNIYDFLVDTRRAKRSKAVAAKMQEQNPSAVISHEAQNGGDPACKRALDMFAALYGAEAGNLALKALSTGGLYVGGGIAPKIIDALGAGGFMEAFRDKGRMSELMARVPVRVITEPRTALKGALAHAVLMAQDD